MVVIVKLRLYNVLVASESISVVHVAELLNELVHDTIVPEFLLVDHLCLLLDHMIVSYTVGQFELVIKVKSLDPDTFFFDICNRGGLSCLLRGGILLIVDVLHGLPQLLLPDVSEKSPGHHSLTLSLLGYAVIPEAFETVFELLSLHAGLLREGMGPVWVLRSGINVVDEVWPILVGCHICLEG